MVVRMLLREVPEGKRFFFEERTEILQLKSGRSIVCYACAFQMLHCTESLYTIREITGKTLYTLVSDMGELPIIPLWELGN